LRPLARGTLMRLSGEIDGSVHGQLSLTVPRTEAGRDVLPYYIPSGALAQGRVGRIWPDRLRHPREIGRSVFFMRAVRKRCKAV
jgi:hypothetical protein